MNSVILSGRLVAKPTIKYSQTSNMAVASYRMAVERNYKSKDADKPEVDFISCTAFGKNAEFAEKYLDKGMKILVRGFIRTGSYEKNDGTKVYTTDVQVDQHEILSSPRKNDNGGTHRQKAEQVHENDSEFEEIEDMDGYLPF